VINLKKFDPHHLHKLDSPKRREILPPDLPVTLFGFVPGTHIVDFGCGSGYFSVDLAETIGPSGILYAVDQRIEMLEALTERMESHGLKNFRRLQNLEHEIPLESASVHGVFMATVYHELLSPLLVVKEAIRVLKPDGRLMVIDWRPIEEEMGPRLHHRIAPESVIQDALNAGFVFSGEIGIHNSFFWLSFMKPDTHLIYG